MEFPQTSPYGGWKSPITADLVAGGEIGLEQVRIDGDDIYWIERRAHEGGRKVLVRRSGDATVADITPAGFNARTRVHEYGGGDYAVSNGTIIFSNFTDQQLYRQQLGSEPTPLTPQNALRYADGQIDRHKNLLFCVREDHSNPNEIINTLVRVDLRDGNTSKIVASGNDFYSSPRLSPDGFRLAWLTWNHPNMPWDGTELWVGKLGDDGAVTVKEKVAGGVDESIFQPEWSPDGTLYFVSDRTGWWNLYRWRERRSRSAVSDGSRVWPTSVGLRHQPLRLRIRAATGLHLCQERARLSCHFGHGNEKARHPSSCRLRRSRRFAPLVTAWFSSAHPRPYKFYRLSGFVHRNHLRCYGDHERQRSTTVTSLRPSQSSSLPKKV